MVKDLERQIMRIFKALSDATRKDIFRVLCDCEEEGGINVSDICEKFHFTQPTISHHLQILRSSDLVDTRKEGKNIYYYVKKEVVNDVFGNIMEMFHIEVEE